MARRQREREDPTGQARNRKKGTRALTQRLNRAERQVKALFRNIPRERRRQVSIVNQAETVIYDYQLSDQELADLQTMITAILDQQLLETQTGNMPFNWYWQDNVEPPYRQGTAEEVNRFNQLIAGAVIAGVLIDGLPPQAVPIESVLLSEPYRQALNNVFVSNFSVIKNLSERTSAQVIQQINLGIQAGDTPTDIAKAITERFDVSRSSAERIARTEVNKALNDGKLKAVELAAEQTGLRAGVIHISALIPTTRATHAARHGNAYTVADQLQWWNTSPNRINCFIPGTEVQGRFTAGLKSHYSGKVVKLMTRDGRNLTVTPNHKVMTDSGLIAAAKINKGDNLLAYGIKNKNSVGIANLDVNKANSRIENVFASLSKIGNSSVVRPMSVDFNGDERFIDKDINAVFTERPLIHGRDPEAFKALDYLKFKHSDSTSIGFSSFFKRLKRIFLATPSIMCSGYISFLLFARHIVRLIELRLAGISWGKADLSEAAVNCGSGNVELTRNCQNGLPRNVHFDEVIDIDIIDFSGHVYDLQEDSGLMIANGIIASNCLCTTQSVLIDRKGKVVQKEFQEDIKAERAFFDKD